VRAWAGSVASDQPANQGAPAQKEESLIRQLTFVVLAVTGIGIGVVIGVIGNLGASDRQSVAGTVSAPAPVAAAGPRTTEQIEALKAELVRVTQYEVAYGCMTRNRFGEPELCGASKARVDAIHDRLVQAIRDFERRDATAVAAVVARIRDLSEDPTRTATFEGTSANPYTNTGKRIELYRDTAGLVYWVDPTGNTVVQFGPGPNSSIAFAQTGSRSPAELRGMAERYLRAHLSDFARVQSEFAFQSSAKPGGASYAFRWQASTKGAGEDVAPFVQLVVSPAGEVMSFADTRSLYAGS
jgi:hypothetical protein